MQPRRKIPLAIALTLSAAFASAATLNVPSQYSTLRSAIKAAATGDTILIAPGIYSEATDVGTIQWGGKDLIIRGAGTSKTTFRGGYTERIIYTSNLTAASRIEGINFTEGLQAGGAAICNDGGSLTIAGCAFEGNKAANGGAILNKGGNPTIVNCRFRGNMADSNGSCVHNIQSNVTITNCVFENNAAVGDGTLYNDHSTAKVTNCIFRGNQADNGGGISNLGQSTSTVVDCVFFQNTAGHEGGGVYNNFSSASTVVNCTFVNNSTKSDSKHDATGSPVPIKSGFGGAICCVTESGYGNNNATVTNTIFWGNTTVAADKHAVHGPVTLSCSDLQDLTSTTPDANGNFAADPLFVNLTNGNLHLQAKSPCLERGKNPTITAAGALTDEESCRRISSSNVDIGAFEFQSLTDISDKISLKKMSESSDAQGTITQKFVITNNTGTLLEGPISIVVFNITGYTLSNRTGVTGTLAPAGRSYVNLPTPLLPSGASTPVTLVFTKSNTGTLSYKIQVVDGIGSR